MDRPSLTVLSLTFRAFLVCPFSFFSISVSFLSLSFLPLPFFFPPWLTPPWAGSAWGVRRPVCEWTAHREGVSRWTPPHRRCIATVRVRKRAHSQSVKCCHALIGWRCLKWYVHAGIDSFGGAGKGEEKKGEEGKMAVESRTVCSVSSVKVLSIYWWENATQYKYYTMMLQEPCKNICFCWIKPLVSFGFSIKKEGAPMVHVPVTILLEWCFSEWI